MVHRLLTQPTTWAALFWTYGDYVGVFHVGKNDYVFPENLILYTVMVAASAYMLPGASRAISRSVKDPLDSRKFRQLFLTSLGLKIFGFSCPIMLCLSFTSESPSSHYFQLCGAILIVWYAYFLTRQKNFHSEFGKRLAHFFISHLTEENKK